MYNKRFSLLVLLSYFQSVLIEYQTWVATKHSLFKKIEPSKGETGEWNNIQPNTFNKV